MRSSFRVPGWLIAIGVYAALTCLYAWPLLGSFGTRLPGDTGDPGLNTWILWWNTQAVPLTSRWWNAPIFAPAQGAFALSETLLSVAILTTPLQWLGATAVQAYNTAFLLSYFSAALAAHALAYRVSGSHRAAMIAGVSFGFNPYRAAHISHLQLLTSCWMPLALLALHKYKSERRAGALSLLGLCWLLNGLTTGYFLVFFAVLVAGWMVWFVRSRAELAAISLTLAAASLPLALLLAGYRHYQEAFGLSRSLGEIQRFSADLGAIWAASAYAWLPFHWTLTPEPEGELYPGAMLLLLVAAGVLMAWPRRARARRIWEATPRRGRIQLGLVVAGMLFASLALISWIWGGSQLAIAGLSVSTSHPYKSVTSALWLFGFAGLLDARLAEAWRRRSTFVFYVLAAIGMLVFALGPTGRVLGARFLYIAPYAALMQLPGGSALRVPARFGALMMLCLAQAAALAVARRRLSSIVVALICAVIALDGWIPTLKTDPVPAPLQLSAEVRQAASDGLRLLELPMIDLYSDTAAMLRATRHHLPLVNGYSGYMPPHYPVLQQGVQDMDESVLTAQGQLLVFVDRARDDAGRYRAWMNTIRTARQIQEDGAGVFWEVHDDRPVSRGIDALPPPLHYTSVTTRGGTGTGELLLDNDLSTAWHSRPDESVAPEIRVTFARPVSIEVLQLNIGPLAVHYPKRVRVVKGSAYDAAQPAEAVWEGGLAGAAMTAVFADMKRLPLQIDLPRGTPATAWTVTVLSDDPKRYWGVTELRMFGR
jgi:hypothetical protein